MKSIHLSLLLRLIPAIMLLLAPFSWPYAYYQILRFVVFGACGFLSYKAWQRNKANGWGWIFSLAFLSLLFNPIIPVYLERETWFWIDIASAVFLLVHLKVFKYLD